MTRDERQRRRTARAYRKLLGRHDRWTNPALAGIPRGHAKRLPPEKFFTFLLKATYNPSEILRRQMYTGGALFALLPKQEKFR